MFYFVVVIGCVRCTLLSKIMYCWYIVRSFMETKQNQLLHSQLNVPVLSRSSKPCSAFHATGGQLFFKQLPMWLNCVRLTEKRRVKNSPKKDIHKFWESLFVWILKFGFAKCQEQGSSFLRQPADRRSVILRHMRHTAVQAGTTVSERFQRTAPEADFLQSLQA